MVRRLILGVRLGGIFRGMELERRIVPKVPVATQGDEVGLFPDIAERADYGTEA